MHVLEFEQYEVRPTQECFLIKPLRELYNADRTKNKDHFMSQLSVVYFMADPRSSYNYILDEDERFKEICRQEGLPKEFKLDKKLEQAIEEYKRHTVTASLQLLQDTKLVIENMRKVLKSIDFDTMDETKSLMDDGLLK